MGKHLPLLLTLLAAPALAGEDYPFQAYETVPLAATTTSASVTFKLPASGSDNQRVLVYNAGSADAFGACAKGAVTATLPGTTGTTRATPFPAGAVLVLTVNDADTCAAITASGTATLYFTAGKGE